MSNMNVSKMKASQSRNKEKLFQSDSNFDPYHIANPNVIFKTAELMDTIESNSIGLIVTSPPYGQIKDYGIENQIGFTDDFEQYFSRLMKVWKECHRVLQSQRRMIINVGDQYLRAKDYGRYRILPIAARIIQDCISLGFDYLGDIIWQKVSTTNTSGGCSLMGSLFYPSNGLATFDYEHILIFKKVEGKEVKVDPHCRELSKISMDEWKEWFVGHWKILGTQQDQHVAMFPEEIPYRLIRMFSFIGDIVLDPFCGSGTTLKIASRLSRSGIGYEINPTFEPIIKEKINSKILSSFLDFHVLYQFLFQNQIKGNYQLNWDFVKQKSIICANFSADQNSMKVVFDLMSFSPKDFEADKYLSKFKTKLQENNILNFIEHQDTWSEISKFIIVLHYPKEYTKEIQKYVEELSYQQVYFIPFEKIQNNIEILQTMF